MGDFHFHPNVITGIPIHNGGRRRGLAEAPDGDVFECQYRGAHVGSTFPPRRIARYTCPRLDSCLLVLAVVFLRGPRCLFILFLPISCAPSSSTDPWQGKEDTLSSALTSTVSFGSGSVSCVNRAKAHIGI